MSNQTTPTPEEVQEALRKAMEKSGVNHLIWITTKQGTSK